MNSNPKTENTPIHSDDLAQIISIQQEIAMAPLEANSLMALICQHAQNLTRSAGAVVEIAEGDEMVYKVASGSVAGSEGLRIKSGTSLSGMAVRTNTILSCADSEADPRVDLAACRKINVRSMIVVPLTSKGASIGVLKVLSPVPNAFGHRETNVLQLMAGLLSASLGHAQMVITLTESERKFRHLVDAAYSAIIISENGVTKEANSAFCEMFGYTPAELVGFPYAQLAAPAAHGLLREKISSNDDRPYELLAVKKDGTIFTVEAVGRNLEIDGRIVRVTAARDISERIRIEQTIRASEMKFRSVLHSVNDSVVATNKDGAIVAWNRSAEMMFGYPESEALGKNITMLMPERFRARHTAGMKHVATGGDTKLMGRTVELVGLRNSNEEFPIELSLATWNHGSDMHFTSVIRDLSEKKRAEHALNETTKTLQTLISSSPVGILVMDLDLNLTLWNPTCEKMFGWTSEEVLGRPLPFVSADKRESSNNIMATMLKTHRKLETQAERRRKDGTAIYIQISAMPLMNDKNEVYAHMGVVTDISDQTHAAVKLREARNLAEREKEFSQSITRLAPNHIYVFSIQDDVMVYMNRHLGEFLGYSSSQIKSFGKNFLSFIMHPEDLPRFIAHRKRFDFSRSDVAIEFEWRAKNADNDWRYIMLRESIFQRRANGTPEQIIGIAQDITELREKEIEILRANEALTLATKAKSEFLANMSHEIRTPLNGVVGMAGLLLDTELSAEQKDYTDAVRSSAETLLTIINDILDFSKVEAGKMSLEIIDFSIDEVVLDIEKSLTFAANKKGLSLFRSKSPSLPDYFKGDPTRIRQVLLNLVANAIKFTPSGHVRIEVKHDADGGAAVPAGSVMFEVTDTGIGIPDEAMTRMFQPFSQADNSTTRKFGGTGLGLSICKHLVNLMGGKIGVRSEAGKGSTFWFSLPLDLGSAPLKEKHSDQISTTPHQKLRILIAEDISVNQIIAIKMFERLGHTAMAVANGLEVLESLRETPFDVVFMDCQMPEMDGYQTTRNIRASKTLSCTGIPIIAMTANAMEGDREKCLESGMDDYITKPIRARDLEAAIARTFAAKLAS